MWAQEEPWRLSGPMKKKMDLLRERGRGCQLLFWEEQSVPRLAPGSLCEDGGAAHVDDVTCARLALEWGGWVVQISLLLLPPVPVLRFHCQYLYLTTAPPTVCRSPSH